MGNTAGPTRRTFRYQTFDDLIDDVGRLRAGPYQRCGQWSLTQNCEHLDLAMRASMTHFDDVPLGWLIRATVGRLILKRMLSTGQLGGKIEAAAQVRPQAIDDADDPARIDRMLATAKEVATGTRFVRSPFFGDISADEWRQFHLIHAAHHLSHLVPS